MEKKKRNRKKRVLLLAAIVILLAMGMVFYLLDYYHANDTAMAELEQSARSLGAQPHQMMSGAGHDALSFAELVPTAMLFIPCRGGISHNTAEFTTDEAICTGAMVLCDTLARHPTGA